MVQKEESLVRLLAKEIFRYMVESGIFGELVKKEVQQIEENKPEEKPKELHTIRETKKILKVSVPTIYKRINDGTLEAKKIGGRTLITEASIQKALQPIEAKRA